MKQLVTTLVFLVENERILLAMKKRGFGAGKWNGVGGKLDRGETPEQAMIRECQEEIGVTPRTYHQVAYNIFYEPHHGEPCKNMVHTYFCTSWEGEPTETEEMAPQWFKTDQIPYDTMWADDRYWMPLVLDGKKVSTVFRYNHSTELKHHTITEVASFDEP